MPIPELTEDGMHPIPWTNHHAYLPKPINHDRFLQNRQVLRGENVMGMFDYRRYSVTESAELANTTLQLATFGQLDRIFGLPVAQLANTFGNILPRGHRQSDPCGIARRLVRRRPGGARDGAGLGRQRWLLHHRKSADRADLLGAASQNL